MKAPLRDVATCIVTCPGCLEDGLPYRHSQIYLPNVPREHQEITHAACNRVVVVGPNLDLIVLPRPPLTTPATVWKLMMDRLAREEAA